MIIVSACFLNIKCRYNGEATPYAWISNWVEKGLAIVVCPEVLGDLPIPRAPCEIQNRTEGHVKIVDNAGKDQTEAFLLGAEKTWEIAKIVNAKCAILKARSPSCGFGEVYDGSFSGQVISGNGVTANLLEQNGIVIFNENQEDDFLKYYNKLSIEEVL